MLRNPWIPEKIPGHKHYLQAALNSQANGQNIGNKPVKCIIYIGERNIKKANKHKKAIRNVNGKPEKYFQKNP